MMKSLTAAVLALGLGLVSPAVLAAGSPVERADSAAPLSPGDVYELYAGKTWIWAAGGAYFAPDRSFWAYSAEGGEETIATGRWRVTEKGRLCLDADWRKVEGDTPARTCFSHRAIDGVVLQKAEPGGIWAELAGGDANPNAFVSGNTIDAQYADFASRLATR